MASTALQLIQAACNEMGVQSPVYAVGNNVADVIQQLALLNALGAELQTEYPWERLTTEYRFTTLHQSSSGTTTSGSAVITGLASTTGLDTTYMVSGTGINTDVYIVSVDSSSQVTVSQAATASGTTTINFGKTQYSLPSDFNRLIDRTEWDKTRHWEMLGPETSQQWQWLKSGYISTGPRVRYRILGGLLQLWPMLTTSEYIGFEYLSNAWALSASSVKQSAFLADTDTCIFPDRLMIVGLKKKYFEVKGFASQAFAEEFGRLLNQAKAQDGGARVLSLAPRPSSVLITSANIPDSGYGS